MEPSTYDSEIYKAHAIHIYTEQPAPGLRWIIYVKIQRPDGSWLPDIEDNDRTFETPEMALTTGSEIGRQVIDNH